MKNYYICFITIIMFSSITEATSSDSFGTRAHRFVLNIDLKKNIILTNASIFNDTQSLYNEINSITEEDQNYQKAVNSSIKKNYYLDDNSNFFYLEIV